MAFYNPNGADDERLAKERANAALSAAGGGVSTGGGPGGGFAPQAPTPGGGVNAAPVHNQAPGSAGSGLFTPLQNYLTANADKAGQMGQALAGNIAASGAAATAAKDRSDKGYDPTTGYYPSPGQPRPDTTPQNQPGYGDAVSAANKAANEVGASSSQGGRQALMGQYYGRPGYTQGQSAMDAFLVGGGGMSPLESVQAQYGGIRNALQPQPAPGVPDVPEQNPTPQKGKAGPTGAGTTSGGKAPPEPKKPPKRGVKGAIDYGTF